MLGQSLDRIVVAEESLYSAPHLTEGAVSDENHQALDRRKDYRRRRGPYRAQLTDLMAGGEAMVDLEAELEEYAARED
jgi:hypothetical protein